MVLGGDVPSDCNLASFRHARFFDFFNEIGQLEPSARACANDPDAPKADVLAMAIG